MSWKPYLENLKVALTRELLYADDLVVIAKTEEDLIKRLNEYKDNMQNRGMRINMNTKGQHPLTGHRAANFRLLANQ